MLFRIGNLAQKELLQLTRDVMILIMILVGPVLQLALIARSTAAGDYPLLLASTLSMILTVVTISRLVWRRLYRLAEERYRLE